MVPPFSIFFPAAVLDNVSNMRETYSERVFTLKGEIMDKANGIVFSDRISAGRTTYFVDVRQAVNDRFYVSFTESRRVSDSGFEQSRVFLFEENLEEIGEMLSKAFSKLHAAVSKRGPLPESDGGKYERSGKTWTEEEEELLQSEFGEGTDREKIAEKLKRSSYAVTLRLEKLGLIEKPEKEKVSV